MSDFEGLDRDLLLAQFGGDEELLGEIIAIFLEDHVEQIRQMQEAVAAQDAKGLEVAAHTLKGSISNFGAETARETAFQLEKMGREGAFADAPETLDRLVAQVADVVGELQQMRNAA